MGATLGLTSCNDFLDMTPTDKISDYRHSRNQGY